MQPEALVELVDDVQEVLAVRMAKYAAAKWVQVLVESVEDVAVVRMPCVWTTFQVDVRGMMKVRNKKIKLERFDIAMCLIM